MNIVLATDDNFVQHCGVAMVSILKNNEDVTFFLLTEGLTHENSITLSKLVKNNGGILNFCVVPSDIVKYFPMSKMASNHISIATYYRLFITSLLPDNVDKAIYLDCDMVIRGSLVELWNTDVTNYALGAVYQNFAWSDHEKSWTRLDIPREYGYFNAGCLLLNLKYLRQDKFQDKAVRFIHEKIDDIISHDQDILNALYYMHTLPVCCKWNCTPLFLSKIKKEDFPQKVNYAEEVQDQCYFPVIIHYVSKPKPWQFGCSHKYKSEYYKYLGFTPWKDNKPEFQLKRYINDVIIANSKILIKRMDIFGIIDQIKGR